MAVRLRAALLGSPVAHSLSPTLHRAAGLACGVLVDYTLMEVSAAQLGDTLDALARARIDGLNLTAPHKVAALSRCAWISDEATRVGAVNTLVVDPDGALRGHNTDVEGFARAARPLAGERVLLLGAGGAARAVLEASRQAGVARVTLCNRHRERAAALLTDLGWAPDARGLDAAEEALADATLVINALPRHLNARVARLPWDRLPPGARLLDLSYGAASTPILQAARRAGVQATDGLAMLAWQGIAAFRLWTGEAPPPAPVFAALRAASALDARTD